MNRGLRRGFNGSSSSAELVDNCETVLFLAGGFRQSVALEEEALRTTFLVEVPARLKIDFGGDVILTRLLPAGRLAGGSSILGAGWPGGGRCSGRSRRAKGVKRSGKWYLASNSQDTYTDRIRVKLMRSHMSTRSRIGSRWLSSCGPRTMNFMSDWKKKQGWILVRTRGKF